MNNLELNWINDPSPHELPTGLDGWILHPHSFMQRLRQKGALNPRIQVLRQSWQFPTLDEKKILGMKTRAYALIREVLIYSDGKKWMYARTVFPRKTLTGKQLCLARLKNRSLGSVLFKDPMLERSPFDVVCLSNDMLLHQYIIHEANIEKKDLWARRSVFTLHEKPLLLTEVFLPDIATL